LIRKYRCIKDFPNTTIKAGDIIEIEKLDTPKGSTEYIIDGVIGTTGEIVYEYFEKVRLPGFKYSPYSHSKMETWVSCPKKFEFNYIIKPDIPKPPSPILEKGTLFHAILEHDMKNELENLEVEDEFKALKKDDMVEIVDQALNFTNSEIYQKIKKLSGIRIAEQEMFLGAALEPVKTLEESLIRGFIDLLIVDEENKICYIYDWKTGGKSKEQLKKWPKPNDQLQLYSIWAMQMFDIEKVKTGFVYVEHNHIAEYNFSIKDLEPLKKKFKEKINNIENDTKFKMNNSILCAWCDFREECLGLPLDKNPREITKEDIFMAAKLKLNANKPKREKKSNPLNDRLLKKVKN